MKLSKSIKYNTIIVCIKRLIKIKDFILIINKIVVKNIINLFINNVYKLYKFFYFIVFNYGFEFNSFFWKILFRYLDINKLLLTIFYFKIDN